MHACLDKCWYLTLRKTLSEWTVYSFLFSRSLCNKNRQSKCFFLSCFFCSIYKTVSLSFVSPTEAFRRAGEWALIFWMAWLPLKHWPVCPSRPVSPCPVCPSSGPASNAPGQSPWDPWPRLEAGRSWPPQAESGVEPAGVYYHVPPRIPPQNCAWPRTLSGEGHFERQRHIMRLMIEQSFLMFCFYFFFLTRHHPIVSVSALFSPH